MNQIEKNSLLIVAGTALFMIMFGIGSIPLLDPDEPVYAETAREMLAAGDGTLHCRFRADIHAV